MLVPYSVLLAFFFIPFLLRNLLRLWGMLWYGWKSLLRKAGKAHLTEEVHILHKQEDPAYTTALSAMEMNHLDGWGPAVWDSDIQNTKGWTPKWLWTFLCFFYGQQEHLRIFICVSACYTKKKWKLYGRFQNLFYLLNMMLVFLFCSVMSMRE